MAYQLTTRPKSEDPLLNAGIFSKSVVDSVSASLGEPAWMLEKRRVSWTVFEETPLPTTSDEDWRRTNIKRVKWNKMSLPTSSTVARASTVLMTSRLMHAAR
jgi:hypothetical protein